MHPGENRPRGGITMMFSGFRSRWTTPSACAYSRADRTGPTIESVRFTVNLEPAVPCRLISWPRRCAGEQLHGQEQTSVTLPELHHLDDIGMGELGREPGLELEPPDDLVDSRELGMKQFQRDRRSCRQPRGAKHLPHAAVADQFQEAVVAERAADERCVIHCGLRLLDRQVHHYC